jgi:hypothetical protein
VLAEVKGSFSGDPSLTRGPRFAQLVSAHFSGVEGVRYKKRTTDTRPDGARTVVADVLWGVARCVV